MPDMCGQLMDVPATDAVSPAEPDNTVCHAGCF
jgi:hypothetical protein